MTRRMYAAKASNSLVLFLDLMFIVYRAAPGLPEYATTDDLRVTRSPVVYRTWRFRGSFRRSSVSARMWAHRNVESVRPLFLGSGDE
ncbi:hypothetical protein FIBSPDRAFT_968541 [Athelia psychrophila]|uniref:Secreted protein n=1 Tax=Athelia psychrophila TaxID=1759441 RepID=A0A167UHS3_9AGAM|nr:hypothetical protein FIBSPDRAFT_968541 [Fibularhizoctonia sp. CBS 109695]